jgi:hypothetical protein
MFDAAVLSRPLPEGSFFALLVELGREHTLAALRISLARRSS